MLQLIEILPSRVLYYRWWERSQLQYIKEHVVEKVFGPYDLNKPEQTVVQ